VRNQNNINLNPLCRVFFALVLVIISIPSFASNQQESIDFTEQLQLVEPLWLNETWGKEAAKELYNWDLKPITQWVYEKLYVSMNISPQSWFSPEFLPNFSTEQIPKIVHHCKTTQKSVIEVLSCLSLATHRVLSFTKHYVEGFENDCNKYSSFFLQAVEYAHLKDVKVVFFPIIADYKGTFVKHLANKVTLVSEDNQSEFIIDSYYNPEVFIPIEL
jgi:hypothetical protein